jgi:predicted PurR-regulated permease PerM
MAVSPRRQLQFWGITLAVLVAALWLLGGTLLPFIAGAAIAYFLDPVADRLERMGLGRVWATTLIAVVAVLGLVLVLLLVVPLLAEQVQGLVAALPEYFAQLVRFLGERFPALFEADSALRKNLAGLEASLREGGLVVFNQVLAGSLRLIDFLLVLVVTPVVTFYLLLDWDQMVARIDAALPREHAHVIRRLAREIDVVLAGFVRGQLSVCLILGIFYAVALMAIGLQFGFLVGFVAGLISFIPFVGSIVGLVLSLGIALFQFWDAKIWIVATAAIFFLGQFLEGNVLSPRLIGRSVGLHPVWLLLALSVFGALFGFAGLLVAGPVAASLGVLGRFAVERYLASPLYTGRPPPGDG